MRDLGKKQTLLRQKELKSGKIGYLGEGIEAEVGAGEDSIDRIHPSLLY